MLKSLFSKDYDAFLALLLQTRVRKKVTQVELAQRLQETQSFVSKCERGERRLDVLELRAWCKALGVNFVEFTKELHKALSSGGSG